MYRKGVLSDRWRSCLSLDGAAWRQTYVSARASARSIYEVPGDSSLLGATACLFCRRIYCLCKEINATNALVYGAGGQIQKDDYGPGCFGRASLFQDDRDQNGNLFCVLAALRHLSLMYFGVPVSVFLTIMYSLIASAAEEDRHFVGDI